jgi:transposase InsO family protein
VYCAVVLDVFSRRVVGWSIDATPTAALVTNALGMVIEQRGRRRDGDPLDQGSQFTSWAFIRRALDSGLMPSMGSVGDCYDNAVIESFWSRMQVELLDRRRWRTRVELANAIFEYLEIFHNCQRRHSVLGMLTPHRVRDSAQASDSGMNPVNRLHGTQGSPYAHYSQGGSHPGERSGKKSAHPTALNAGRDPTHPPL